MSPQLEHVLVYSGTPLGLEVLQSQKRLRTVEVNALLPWARSPSALVDAPPHGLTPLSSLPHLESLSLTLSQASPAHLTFDHVRVLVLTSVWHPMEVFLDSALLPQLRSLTISVPHEDPARLSPQCASHFRVLADKHTRLTELHLKCYKSTVHNPVGGTPVQRTWQKPAPMLAGALCAVIEPLLRLHELRNVSLSFGDFCFAYNASDIQCLAESWPDIETFRLELTTLEQLRAGFESLVHFAEHCPRLRALHLPEMELTHDAFDKIRYPKRPHPLRELNVARVVFPQRTDLSWEMLQFSQRVFPHAGSPVSESA
ncbi:hypothetical protein OH76DRAFT_509123 [Lentinus brumalis]|uniref:F-box domain-containing protein n=1 Tax=Lentinus brumalis TaxID=2498619 RepID=A0A371DB29_9APHY|nr:hypothetical protein OH76DRAFT_509123 [Polyporus brumalis]